MFLYLYGKYGKFRKSIIAALLAGLVLSSEPLKSEAKGANAFTSQPEMTRASRNRNLFSSGARKPSGDPGKPDNSGSGGDDDNGMPQYPKAESVQETENWVDNIDEYIARMEESSDSEEEQWEATEQLQVEESYKSNSDLKKVTKNAHKSKRSVKNLEDVKQKLSEGVNPMEIGYKPTNLGNGFYYIRKPAARIIVKVDPTTGNSDIVAFALRSNTKNMETFATVVNSQCDTKIKINPKAY